MKKNSPDRRHSFLGKIAFGALLWIITLSGSFGQSGLIQPGQNHDYFVGGSASGTVVFNNGDSIGMLFPFVSALFLARFDSAGSALWSLDYSGPYFWGPQAEIWDCATDAAGNIYVLGYARDSLFMDPLNSSNKSFVDGSFIAKHDTSGALLWSVSQSGSANELSGELEVDGNDNVYVLGTYGSGTLEFDSLTLPGATDNGNLYLLKIDSSGTPDWISKGTVATTAFTSRLSVEGLTVAPDGHSYFTGSYSGEDFSSNLNLGSQTIFNTSHSRNMFLAALDPNGNTLALRNFDSSGGDDLGMSMTLDTAGGVYFTGSYKTQIEIDSNTTYFANPQDLLLGKVDSSLNLIWDRKGSPNTGTVNNTVFDLKSDQLGSLVLFGNGDQMVFPPLPPLQVNSGKSVMVKFNSAGDAICANTDILNGHEKIATDSEGAVYSTTIDYGFPNSIGVGAEIVLSKWDVNCNHLWERRIQTYFYVGIEEFAVEDVFNIFPNPSSGLLNIERKTNTVDPIRMEIYSITGQLILSELLNGRSSVIDLATFGNGIYTIKLIGEQKVWTSRIVKNDP